MFKFMGVQSSPPKDVLGALDQSLSTIEFDAKGIVIGANRKYCRTLGYDISEIRGRHHSFFVDPSYVASPEYKAFWTKIGRGEFDAGDYKRITKAGNEIWIQASYNPIKNRRGEVVRIIKQATDITAEKLRGVEVDAKMTAIMRSQAVIEFHLSGEVITANQNFLDALGYSLDEIKGQHHRLFVEPGYAQTQEYQDFWRRLNAGEYFSSEYKRIGKDGREVWIQASYNPVFDLNQKVFKIIKYATDITKTVMAAHEIGAGLAEIANKNVARRIDRPLAPAFDGLRVNFNKSLEQISSTLGQVGGCAQTIGSQAKEIAAASDDLSRRTEQQAASLEETAVALDEITATVRKTAEGARHARTVVSTARSDAERSGLIVRKAVEAMSGIERSSREIAQIIGVIDEIAFQTNLLALNAGVEAARAGEAGRGFAVVASEVRALAQRSADAAKEIKALISTSGQQVEQGVACVGQTGEALGRIVAQVSEIDGIVGEIASSAQEQATGLDQVNTAVNQMDQVTQQNAAMVEESTAASQALASETRELTRLVEEFELGSESETGARRAAPAPQPAARPPVAPVRALRTVGTGGAARKPQPAAGAEEWSEF